MYVFRVWIDFLGTHKLRRETLIYSWLHFFVFGYFEKLRCRENAVTSCLKCNGKKGSLTLPQLRSIGMKLSREPFVPTQHELAARASRMVPRKVHPVWAPYLGLPPKVSSSSNCSGDAKHPSRSRGKDEEWYFENELWGRSYPVAWADREFFFCAKFLGPLLTGCKI